MSLSDTAAGPDFPRRLILLVDDDVLILALLGRCLTLGGFDVRIASGGQMALDMVLESNRLPDLALLDIQMPGMSGIELATQLQGEYGVAVMFLSATDDAAIVAQATDGGAVGYLVKPIDTAHIVPSVKAALARADDIRQLRSTELRLSQALQTGREIGMAVGMLIERYRIDRDSAFRMLREHARSKQRKLNDVACELIDAAESLNRFSPPVPGRKPG